MTLDQDGAVLVIGATAVLAAGWGAVLSVRSAARGPRWALHHLTATSRLLLVPALIGAALTFVVRPAWVGLGVVYVGMVVWWLAGLLRRNLLRLEEVGGLDEVSDERRSVVVTRARRLLSLGGAAVALLGGLVLTVDAATGGVALALGAVLLGTAVLVRPDS